MAIYLTVSLRTRQARKKIEELGNKKGKDLLKKFLDVELKNKLSSKSNATSLIDYVEKSDDSNICRFAEFLKNSESDRKKFKKAIEYQAKSAGTRKKGLFYTLIYQNGNLSMENLNKSKIKAFLLAKSDNESIINDQDVTCEEDKKSHRMKNPTIVEKLKSRRLSNILKVLMVLILWKYLQLQNKQPDIQEAEKNNAIDNSQDSAWESVPEDKCEPKTVPASKSENKPDINIESNLKLICELQSSNKTLSEVEEAKKRPPLSVDDETFKKTIDKYEGTIVYRGIIGPNAHHFKTRYKNLMEFGSQSSTMELEEGGRHYGEGVYWSDLIADAVDRYGLIAFANKYTASDSLEKGCNIQEAYCITYMAYKLEKAHIKAPESAEHYFIMKDNLSFVIRKNFLDLSPYNALDNTVKTLKIKNFPHHIGEKIYGGTLNVWKHNKHIPTDWWDAVGIPKPEPYAL